MDIKYINNALAQIDYLQNSIDELQDALSSLKDKKSYEKLTSEEIDNIMYLNKCVSGDLYDLDFRIDKIIQ